MRLIAQLGSIAFVALALTACPSDPTPAPGTDAGPRTDTPPGVDAPSLIDAPDPTDAPSLTDVPGLTDVLGTDAPTGPPACAAAYAGCTAFTDLTGMASTTVAIGPGFAYNPNCIRVDAGTMVTLPGASIHPLMQGCGAEDVGVPAGGSTVDQTITFDVAGTYGFYCMFHGAPDGTGMAMAIEVVP